MALGGGYSERLGETMGETTGVERLRELGREQEERSWSTVGKVRGRLMLEIAGQIEDERLRERLAVGRVASEMELHCLGVEGMEDSPVARWARELREALVGDAEADEDREAAAWVREHGGLDYVRAEWRSRVPHDLYERRRQRLLGHIAECETALGRRRRSIEELGRRVGDLTRENAELRKRAMPEGCDEEFIKLHMSNLWGFMFDVMDRLGVDKSDIDAPEIVFDALDRRLMPEGYEWPLFEDGARVRCGDEFLDGLGHPHRCTSIELVRGDGEYGACDSFLHWNDDEPDEVLMVSTWEGERVKRPAVLAADGEPLEAGQTVWDVDGHGPLVVSAVPSKGEQLVVLDNGGTNFYRYPEKLTHERPDSWERLEEDAEGIRRDIAMHLGDYSQSDFGEPGDSVQSRVVDLVRRARALAERGQ